MPDIFVAIENLKQFQNSKAIKPAQREFINTLFKGIPGPQGWRNLDQVAEHPLQQEIENLRAHLKRELARISTLLLLSPPSNRPYERALKTWLTRLEN